MAGCSAGLTVAIVMALLAFPATALAAVAGQWRMNETSGSTAFDSSGNGNNGALTNVTLGLTGSSGAAGDHAFGFNGHSSKMVIPKSASLAAGSADVTVTMDVRTTVEPGTGDFDYDLWSKGGYQVEIFPKQGVGQARCKFIGSLTKAHIQAGPDLADGKWHTISCHKGASSISVTIDGTTFSQPVKLGSLNTGGLAWVGVGSNGTDYYNGQLDNLIVTIG
ncbi:MAG TPA: LamG-like jellyroll fold domain-containing protein [Gaiellales bacterium]|jgi:hypothetical protein|nr:LamG-like jellyroll fold domain-containing protein [Gaiellales bacterium]